MYNKVYIEITNICNKNCSFCHGTKREPRQMSLGEFARVVSNLKGITEHLYFHLLGEPLSHPMLPTFIEYAKACGLKVAITTNGTLLSKRGREIVEAGIYKVNISVHSFESGSQEDYLRYLGDCFDFADYASSMGVLTVLRLWNQGHDGGRNIDTVALLHERFPNEWSFGKRGARIRDKLHLEYGERFEWPDMEACDRGDSVFCYGLKDHIGILSDGSVVPCCLDADGEITLGNIFEERVEDIVASPRARAIAEGFKTRHAPEDLCRRCGYARRFG